MASAHSRQLARAKRYLMIDPLVLCGEIVTEVSIPHNLVHMVTVVAQVLARIASSCHRRVLPIAFILTAL